MADTKVTISGDASGLFKALSDSSLAMKAAAKEIEGATGGLKSMFTNLAAPLVAITAVVGGKEFLKGTIEETKSWTVEAQKLARVLGITTEQASVLNLAIGDIYGTQEEYLGAVAKLTKTLNTNEEAFKKLGVATRDQNGRLRDTPSIMADVNLALMGMKVGTDRNIASAQIYGKSWMEVQRYLKLTPEVMQAAQEKAEKLNLIVGADAVEATDSYRASMNDLDDTLKGLKIRIGKELMPLMTEWNKELSEYGPEAVSILGDSFSGLYQVILGLREQFEKGLVGVRVFWDTNVDMARTGKSIMAAIFRGDMTTALAIETNFSTDLMNRLEEAQADMKEIEDRYATKMQGVMGLGPKKKSPEDGGGSGGAGTNDKDGDKEFERLKASLEKQRYEYEKAGTDRGEYLEYKKSQEAAYWKEVLDKGDITDKTRAKVQQEYYKAARAELKKNHDESRQLDDTYRERYIADQMALLNEEEQAAEQALAVGKITDQQALDWKRAIEKDKYELELAGLQDRLAVKGLEPPEIAKINGQIEALEASHRAKVSDLTNMQAALDRQKDGWAGWQEGIRVTLDQAKNHFENFRQAALSVMSGVTNAFAKGIEGLISGQMSLGQAMKSIWKGIVSTVVQALAQLIAQWLVAQIAQKAFGISATSQAVATATAETQASLTAGAAGAWEAYGWIPYVGAGLALAQIAAMEASVAAVQMAPIVAHAVGGLIDQPTLALMGENGREVVAPETDFKQWASGLLSLGANIMAGEASVFGYQSSATRYAMAMPRGGSGEMAGFGGYNDFRGALFLGSDTETKRMFDQAVRESNLRDARRIG